MAKTSLTKPSLFLIFLSYIEGHPKGLFINYEIILVYKNSRNPNNTALKGKKT